MRRNARIFTTVLIVFMCINFIKLYWKFKSQQSTINNLHQIWDKTILNNENSYISSLIYKYERNIEDKVIVSNSSLLYSIIPKIDICNENISTLVFVISKPSSWAARKAIRQTWGNFANTSFWPNESTVKKPVGIIFVTAMHQNDAVWKQMLLYETKTYGDILQGDFVDDFKNQTLKSLLLLKYVAEYCSEVSYIVKTYDDVFIHVPLLMELLLERRVLRNKGFLGFCLANNVSPNSTIVFRENNDLGKQMPKWVVRYEEYPYDKWPTYVGGTLYAINADIVNELLYASRYMPLLSIEDAFITGVLSKAIGAENVCFNDVFASHNERKNPHVCALVARERVSFTNVKPQRMYQLWTALSQDNQCNITAYT